MKKKPEYQKIVDLLTDGKGIWVASTKNQHKEIHKGSLTEEAKVWFHFLASNLLPSKHLTTMRNKGEIALYAILKGYKINVGKMIEKSISDYCKSNYRGLMPHLAIIIELCNMGEITYLWEEEVNCSKVSPLTLIGITKGPRNKG